MNIKNYINNNLNNHHNYEIIRGSFWAFSLKVVAMMFGYVSTYIISNHFGPETMGLFHLSLTITSVITVLSLLGFPTAILRFTGEFNNDYALKTILKKMITLSLIVSLFFIILFFFYSDYISLNIFHDAKLKYFLQIAIFGVPFAVISNIFIEFIRGMRLIKISETIRNSSSIFNLFFISILVFIIKYGNLSPAISNFCVKISVCLISFIYVINKLKQFDFKKVTPISYKRIISTSLPMLATASMFLVMGSVDKIMLGLYKTTYDIGIYSVSLKLATLTSMVLVAINTIVGPKFSELYWAGNKNELKNVIKFSSKLILFSSAPILIIYFIFSRQILTIFGKSFMEGATALIILSIGQFVNSATGSVGYFLNMTGNQNIFRNFVFYSMLANICLNYLLIPKFSYNGAAFATAFSMAVLNISALIYIKNKFNIYMGCLSFIEK